MNIKNLIEQHFSYLLGDQETIDLFERNYQNISKHEIFDIEIINNDFYMGNKLINEIIDLLSKIKEDPQYKNKIILIDDDMIIAVELRKEINPNSFKNSLKKIEYILQLQKFIKRYTDAIELALVQKYNKKYSLNIKRDEIYDFHSDVYQDNNSVPIETYMPGKTKYKAWSKSRIRRNRKS